MQQNSDIQQAAVELQQLMPIPSVKEVSYDVLLDALSTHINEMILHDFSSLVQLLYVMDIPEEKLKAVLNNPQQENAGDVIAAMMIERQLQKIESRRAFKTRNPGSDEERW